MFLPEIFLSRFFVVQTGSTPDAARGRERRAGELVLRLRDRGHARGGGARAAVAPERLGHGEARPLLLDAHREARHAHHPGPLAGLLVREQHGLDGTVDGVADRVPACLGAGRGGNGRRGSGRRERRRAAGGGGRGVGILRRRKPGEPDGRQHDETGHADRRAHARPLHGVTPRMQWYQAGEGPCHSGARRPPSSEELVSPSDEESATPADPSGPVQPESLGMTSSSAGASPRMPSFPRSR